MEARVVLDRIRKRGFEIYPNGTKISVTPKKLVNSQMVNFLKKHKNELLKALYEERRDTEAKHRERKSALRQGRIEVLKVLLRRFLNDPTCREMVNYKNCKYGTPLADDIIITDLALEEYLDIELVNFDYELEDMITMYQHYTPPAKPYNILCDCGYMPPFCKCRDVINKQ